MHGTLHQVGAMDPEIRWLQADRCSHVSSDTMNGSIMTLQLRPATRRGLGKGSVCCDFDFPPIQFSGEHGRGHR